ncbi:MAG: SDR family NAD(P)-dependent oxidoreductase [Deltaproteobacteria bacterium]|nr:SDR family NAD(P)-dependent oxidoreductase [Candidatus Zymogenaceae bacterium]
MTKTIVITGLGEGMGREVAKILAGTGYSIAGFDMNGTAVESLKKELKAIGGDHHLIAMDITDRKGILKFRDDVLKKYGTVGTVLSNVGIGFFGPFEEIELEKALKCLEINVIGAMAIFQAFIPSMRKAGGGKLIAMSSLVGRIPFPFESIYTASKFAITGFIESMEYEVRPYGIKVAIIEPAQVSTTFAAKIHHLPPEKSPYRDRVKRFIDRDNELIKSAPTPEAAARTIVNIVQKDRPKFYNQLLFADAFLMKLNRFLPKRVKDFVLESYMKIRV